VLPVCVLVATVGVQFHNPFQHDRTAKPPHLAATIPVRVPGGWFVRDVPLGATEFMEEVVERTLRTDDILNREYRRGPVTFGVYVAYWGPGKMPTQLVASHTPDRCWTENGWACQEMRFKERLALDGRALQPAEWRRFHDPQGDDTYVLFWQLIEGRAYDFGERFNKIPSPVAWWKNAVQQAVFGSREQYFIRLTASVPFDELWDDPGFAAIVRSLEQLGLVVEAAPAARDAVASTGAP
jgi:hypothetical protein